MTCENNGPAEAMIQVGLCVVWERYAETSACVATGGILGNKGRLCNRMYKKDSLWSIKTVSCGRIRSRRKRKHASKEDVDDPNTLAVYPSQSVLVAFQNRGKPIKNRVNTGQYVT